MAPHPQDTLLYIIFQFLLAYISSCSSDGEWPVTSHVTDGNSLPNHAESTPSFLAYVSWVAGRVGRETIILEGICLRGGLCMVTWQWEAMVLYEGKGGICANQEGSRECEGSKVLKYESLVSWPSALLGLWLERKTYWGWNSIMLTIKSWTDFWHSLPTSCRRWVSLCCATETF